MQYLLGYSTDKMNDFLLNLSLKGIAMLNPHCIKQASPITPAIVMHMSSYIDLTDSTDIVYWCLFLFALFLFTGKSNLVPTSKADVNNKKFLMRQTITYEKDFLIVSMNWSKTIQFCERLIQTPLILIPRFCSLSSVC